MVFTTRPSGGKGERNGLEHELRRHGVVQINSTPNHPTTYGKLERFHQTLKRHLITLARATTLAELQRQIDDFRDEYNHRRPHCSLPHRATPTTVYTARPNPPPANEPTPITESAPTASMTPAPSPCASPANCTTSESAEPTPEPTF
jgi:hypothetical protein